MRELERRVVLSVIDRRWRDHLYEMDYLKDGIGLRAMAQRDPLVEYQREGFALYQSMMGSIREEAVGFLFNLEVEVTGGTAGPTVQARGLQAPDRARQPAHLHRSERGRLGRSRGAQPARPGRACRHRSRPAGGSGAAAAGRTSAAAAAAASGTRCFRSAHRGAAPPPQNRAERRAQEKRGG